MTEEDRGKRRMARHTLRGWALFSLACLGAVVFGSLSDPALDALVALHSAVTLSAFALIVGLMGIDAAAAQIIPAWKGER